MEWCRFFYLFRDIGCLYLYLNILNFECYVKIGKIVIDLLKKVKLNCVNIRIYKF